MTYNYKTRGVCSRSISFDLEDGKVHNVRFDGGCHGNTQGVSRLAEGRSAQELISLLEGVAKLVDGQNIDDVIAKLKGIICRSGTSCPDQFATALKQALEQSAK